LSERYPRPPAPATACQSLKQDKDRDQGPRAAPSLPEQAETKKSQQTKDN
jgi:hypothetical protein